MANHAKKKPIPKKALIGSAVSAGVVGLVLVSLLLIQNGLLETISGHFTKIRSSDAAGSVRTRFPQRFPTRRWWNRNPCRNPSTRILRR